jgi:histidyl-tRNA synthetase
LNQLDLYPDAVTTATQVLFINFGEKETAYSLPILASLREQGVRCEIYPDASKMKKQMQYANQKGIPFVIMTGETEMAESKVMLKNMQTGEQQLISPGEIKEFLISNP